MKIIHQADEHSDFIVNAMYLRLLSFFVSNQKKQFTDIFVLEFELVEQEES
jgi:hypothetical protein